MLAALLLAAAPVALSEEERAWNAPVAPFRIADNLYYVGTADLAAYLVVDPAGMILLDGGLPQSAPLILDSIRQLGFDPKHVRYLINSQAHRDHAGGLAELKRATGAKLLASAPDAALLERGGTGDFAFGDRLTYPPVKADGLLRDKAVLSLGRIRMTARLTPGHTRGCTSWTLPVRADGHVRQALFICGASAPGYRLTDNRAYPWIMEDFRRSFETWRSLPCDLFLGAHASYYGMAEKRAQMEPGKPNPFFDPQGCRAFLSRSEARLRVQAAKETATTE
ncbi:subclass B3 metallo-beta-lactamase [Sphingomonas sp. ID1715]|uniref:subclass B3 metallo-beta-lactamase n=1 Tax=Sphingomonas sp. ID1715 TaxID=1656898 RepID=UPI001487645B|nr:subclass B3 metallo-beta-lactamase [Sphingomonas sp. ID1715]NNM77422.1 subclass B3 metallo-beta-lactamase [Sphingomonas sp. ID1715]